MSTPTTIEICSSVHTYERRHTWMLSSIVQQEGFDLSRVRVCSAYIDGADTSPHCRDVLAYFRERYPQIGWHDVPYPDSEMFQKRGNVRNRHVEESTADWIAFMDGDMCIPTTFLAELMEVLDTDEFRNENRCLYTGRYSTHLKETEALVDTNPERYPCEVPDAWGQIAALPARKMPSCGAGFFQVARGAFMRDERGYYVPPGKARDWDWSRHSKCKSDHQYRRSVGRKALPVQWLRHIQHKRDSDFGSHVEIQR